MTIWQFIFDLTLFDVIYSPLQFAGFGLLGAAYVVQIMYFFCYEKKKEEEDKRKRLEKEKTKTIMIQQTVTQIRATMSQMG